MAGRALTVGLGVAHPEIGPSLLSPVQELVLLGARSRVGAWGSPQVGSGDVLGEMRPWRPSVGHGGCRSCTGLSVRRAALVGLPRVEDLPLEDGGFPFLGAADALCGACSCSRTLYDRVRLSGKAVAAVSLTG